MLRGSPSSFRAAGSVGRPCRWSGRSVPASSDRINVQTAFVGAAGFHVRDGTLRCDRGRGPDQAVDGRSGSRGRCDHRSHQMGPFGLRHLLSDRRADERHLGSICPRAHGHGPGSARHRDQSRATPNRSGGRWRAHPVIPSRPGSRGHADIDVIAARLSRRKEDQRDPYAWNCDTRETKGTGPAGSCRARQVAKRRKSMDLTRMRRTIVLTAMTALVVTACSSGGSASPSAAASAPAAASAAAPTVAPTATPEPSAAAVTLEYLVDSSQANQQLAKAFAEAYTAKHPNVTINVQSRPGGSEGDNLVKTKLATGDMTDIFWYNAGSLLQALDPTQDAGRPEGRAVHRQHRRLLHPDGVAERRDLRRAEWHGDGWWHPLQQEGL